ncbi:hypothetical protein Zmor_011335 [Zophobas morio]|uniref:Uncharacterized protein n=1 Tax=Zophobas morio TaxID=2755281 RepID=A0AA38IQF3_9CUCU|nr:hypothetical protein Zmor_011335 [Zophobas morio]
MLDLKDPVFIGLVAYSSVITLVCTVLLVLWLRSRKCTFARRRSTNTTNRVESLHQLNRRSMDNPYRINTTSCHVRSLPSVPNKRATIDEYDPIACSSKIDHNTVNPPHEYQKMETNKKEDHQYETIVQHVVTTLSAVYESGTKGGDVYEKFMEQLLKNLKAAHPSLYNSIQSSQGAIYAELEGQVKKQPVVNTTGGERPSNSGAGSEQFYATYIPSESTSCENVANNFNDVRSDIVFGSTDHLKFFVENECDESVYDTNSYLPARRFNPKDGCPEELRRLCPDEKKCANGNKVLNRTPSKETQEVHTDNIPSPHVLSKPSSGRKDEYESIADKEELANDNKRLPRPPPTERKEQTDSDKVPSTHSFSRSVSNEEFRSNAMKIKSQLSFKIPPAVPQKPPKRKLVKSDSLQ